MRLAEIKEDDERTVINREQHEVPMQNEELYEEDHDTTPPPKPSTDAQKPVATAPVKNDEQRTFQTPVSIKGKVLKAEQKAMVSPKLQLIIIRRTDSELGVQVGRHSRRSHGSRSSVGNVYEHFQALREVPN